MNAVRQPESRFATRGGFGEETVQRYVDCVELPRQLARHGDLRVKVHAPRLTVGRYRNGSRRIRCARSLSRTALRMAR
jgi:hypothetical protein